MRDQQPETIPPLEIPGAKEYISPTDTTSVASSSTATTPTAASGPIIGDGIYFKDASGRVVNFRGVNLSGNVKSPYIPLMPSHFGNKSVFYDDRNVSFVGRPFPIEEADEHLGRLQHWGFNFLRFNITWEALEHAGPGLIDSDYISYVIKILHKCKEYGFRCFIDPHQDVWSRFSGGSGAPGWTLDLAGFQKENFDQTGAAIVHNVAPHPANYPKMIWGTNMWKLACVSMFTLFFGGRLVAPLCKVRKNWKSIMEPGTEESELVNIQDFLQDHFMDAITALTQRIHDERGLEDSVVLGYDTLNEPCMGWIGVEDMNIFPEEQELKTGLTPTPIQTLMLGEGLPCVVEDWDFGSMGPKRSRAVLFDPAGVRAWREGVQCIWEQHGVWSKSTQTLLRPDYFHRDPNTGVHISFLKDCWKPFVATFSAKIRAIHKNAMVFVDPPVNMIPPTFTDAERTGLVYAPHWYDGLTLINKHYNEWFSVDYIGFKRGLYSNIVFALRFGQTGIRKCWRDQLAFIKNEGIKHIGNFPCVVGEIGMPMDMDCKASYISGDYSSQIKALDAAMYALESNMLNFTLWNYCSDNCHQWGDGWNGEDLSIWSRVLPLRVKGTVTKLESSTISATTETTLGDTSSNSVPGEVTDKSNGPIDGNSDTRAAVGSIGCAAEISGEDYDIGGRGLEAFCRPYAIYTPGIPKSQVFDLAKGVYKFSFECQLPVWECEVYLPRLHFESEASVEVWSSSGDCRVEIAEQRIYWRSSPKAKLCLTQDLVDKTSLNNATRSADESVEHFLVIRRRSSGQQPDLEELARERDDEVDVVCPMCNIM